MASGRSSTSSGRPADADGVSGAVRAEHSLVRVFSVMNVYE
jgi:hypothetical protein